MDDRDFCSVPGTHVSTVQDCWRANHFQGLKKQEAKKRAKNNGSILAKHKRPYLDLARLRCQVTKEEFTSLETTSSRRPNFLMPPRHNRIRNQQTKSGNTSTTNSPSLSRYNHFTHLPGFFAFLRFPPPSSALSYLTLDTMSPAYN